MVFKNFLMALAAGLVAATTLPYLGASTHDASVPALLAEFFSHFRAQYFVIGLILTAAAVLARNRASLLMAIFAVAVNLTNLAPYYMPAESPPAAAKTKIRILHANVQRGNRDYARLLKLIRAQNPDVIFLQEYDRHWFNAVHSALGDYPHRALRLGAYFGIGVYSRIKPESMRVITPGRARVPSLHLRMRAPGGAVYHLLSSHPPPPIGLRNTRNRNHQLRELAEYIRALKEPVLLAGDLNVSMWSPAFRRLLRDSGLRETRGYGVGTTWPTELPFAMIPIDHCLARGDLFVSEFKVLENTGSDHRPLLCGISVKR